MNQSLFKLMNMKLNVCYVLFNYEDSISNFFYSIDSFSRLSIIDSEFHLYLMGFDEENAPSFLSNYSSVISSIQYVDHPSDLVTYGLHANKYRYDFSQYYFLFINSSCIGPILPSYVDINSFFSHIFDTLDTVSVVSSVVEFPRDNIANKVLPYSERLYIPDSIQNIPFFHTFFFICKGQLLPFLCDVSSFPPLDSTKADAVHVYERLISANLLNHNHTIASIACLGCNIVTSDQLHLWDADLYNHPEKGFETCPEIPYNYFRSDLHPLDCVFFKNIRFPSPLRSQQRSGISDSNSVFLHEYKKYYLV